MFSRMPKASGRLLVQDAGGVLSDGVVGVVVVFVSPLIVLVNVSFFVGMYGWGWYSIIIGKPMSDGISMSI